MSVQTRPKTTHDEFALGFERGFESGVDQPCDLSATDFLISADKMVFGQGYVRGVAAGTKWVRKQEEFAAEAALPTEFKRNAVLLAAAAVLCALVALGVGSVM